MNFKAIPQAIPDVLLLEHREFGDDRGSFTETFRASAFQELGLPQFVQDNQSRSSKGVVRGLHYQVNPNAVGKLVRCVHGRIFDVAVDLRLGSPTYGKWTGTELAGTDNHMFYVPEGFAHGFMALEDDTLVSYRQTGYWDAASERSLLWNDPDVAIDWPKLAVLLSPKDATATRFADVDHNFRY
ncbi:dTDP-4-dehydrorhamnose 3,5-epimerase [Rhizobium rhizogenes]|uniref:dTDP-4-dehydrorhamnose 3,5-epimerase n=1 Tax=Rhizobium rhizogenes NBRC 13257 TaxID=1220581 RepID=A0AA87U6M5_RHIRH|nr:dTDP-4-dehydrorhamnose 3,5-epimerase [Rhizobium rhizogenes]NTG68851.1 dTDP-4-dehydrorhamnose 3,5-epimerase [Rhizobium rhizogenes]NTH53030.1 dTDP-4-dehydrorhamnose 3,5-epimerase [Rhizobium rhizogenes]NTH72614.1 dTDP-4-dehydrorhamnose 3,5-epimerase [Rhizobium rhizogenes]NTI69659.1 dTDP-4-dehydrorhamnose 3,5-epimerase [Rhizobium rhizogenes]TRB04554.1 dTDP-4-dehydrorhamnose 3,5-epimerase [Rhizobium rhizogenes]